MEYHENKSVLKHWKTVFAITNNPVRFTDAFSGQLDLVKLGFIINTLKVEGRPIYQSSIFIRIYLYGYLNGIRSSRKLEREYTRNIEIQWLLHGIMLNYKSISDFRKNNPKALQNVLMIKKRNTRALLVQGQVVER